MINTLPKSLIEAVTKAISPDTHTDRPFTQDEHGKNIVYDNGTYKISVNDPHDANYIALWHENKAVGKMYLGHGRTSDTKGYATVRSVDIDKKHQGQGMGRQMYNVAMKYVHDKYKGIGSEHPDRANKKQVPSIFRKLGGVNHESGDITVDRKPNINESVYYRGTDNISEPDLIKSGQLRNSTNKLTAKEESGVSVSDVPDVKAHFKHMYKVTGKEVGIGSDGEPLLDPKTMKFVNWVNESTNDTHIDVDGVMKHRYNSEGKPIHSTDEGIRNFHRWFGDSDSVDEQGRPKVFHHGTPALSRSQTESTPLPFNEFKHSGSGVHSFSQDHDFAEMYASTKSQDAEMDLAPFVFKTHLKTKTFDPNNEEHINAIRPHLGASVTHEGKYGWSSFGGEKQIPTEKFIEQLKGVHDIYRPLTKEMHEKAEVGKYMGLDGGTILVHHKTPTKLYYSEAYQIPGDLPHDKMEEVRAAARQEPEKPHSMKFTYQPFKEQPWVIRQKEMKIYNTTWVPGKQKGDNWEMTENDQFKEAAKKAGFNAVKQTERRKENVAVFDNTQIKSATHNTGAFAHPTKIDE